MKVCVLGASGFLGSRMVERFKSSRINLITFSSHDADATNYDELSEFLSSHGPSVIINLIALTNVDLCEQREDLARKLNVGVVENITNWIEMNHMLDKVHLIHISSDQVYSGVGPHAEDCASPINIYGKTKLESEKVAQRVSSTVFRTNFFGRSNLIPERGLADWLYKASFAQKKINVFNDIKFNPVFIDTLIGTLFGACNLKIHGIYNFGSRNAISKAEFANLLYNELKFDTSILNSCSCRDAEILTAKRPHDMTVDCTKFELNFGWNLPDIKMEIKRLAGEYKND